MTGPTRSDGRPPVVFLLFFAVALVAVLGFGGTLAYRAVTGEATEAPRTFVEQVEALPVVMQVETDSQRVAGSGNAATLESWITLAPQVTDDPAAAASALAGVTWGYDRSHWSIEGLGSTAEVSYRGPVDEAPVRWWTDAVAALEDADPTAALHCRITDAALHCTVGSDDPGAAREALAGVDGSAVQPWLEGARPDEGEASGFSLVVGGETLTEATSVR